MPSGLLVVSFFKSFRLARLCTPRHFGHRQWEEAAASWRPLSFRKVRSHGTPQTNSLLHFLTMPPVVFSCPATLMNVQHSLDDDLDVPENEYEVITCLACTKLHLINRKTGQILGQDSPRR